MTASAKSDGEWAAAVGLYVAVVSVALAVVIAIVAGASSAAIAGLVPTAFTGGLVCGAIATQHNVDLAVRLGGWRWRTVALCLPAVFATAAAGTLAATDALPGDSALLLVTLVALAVGLPARLLALVAHDRYVEAAIETPNEAIAEWTWHQSGTNASMIALGAGCLLFAAASTLESGINNLSFNLAFVGAGSLAIGWAPTVSVPTPGGSAITLVSIPGAAYVRGTLRVYDDGLVYEPKFSPSYSRIVPRERFTDVRLTDERLVLERRLRPAIRCDRSAIDDLEGALEALESAVDAERSPTHRLTTLERERNP